MGSAYHHPNAQQDVSPELTVGPADGAGSNGAGEIVGHVTATTKVVLAGASLTLIDTAGRQRGHGTSGADGRYAMRVGEPGLYILTCAHPGHQPQATRLMFDGHIATHDVELTGTGTLTGSVLHGPQRGQDRPSPVPGTLLTLSDTDGRVVATTRSDSLGRYTLNDLSEGQYALTANPPGASDPVASTVHITAGGRDHHDVLLSSRTALSGTVVSAVTGQPLPEVLVTLTDGDANMVASTRTDADGRFRFADLPADDSYSLTATGYPPTVLAAPLTADGPHRLTVRLGREGGGSR